MLEQDQRASEKIAGKRLPGAALTAPSAILGFGDQPVTFDRVQIVKQFAVGRTGALDDTDAGQKIDPAARSVQLLNGPISR